LMAYDSKNLYMAFKVKQDKSTIRATVARRDSIWNDDYIILYMDTFNDKRQAYALGWNPLGIQADGTMTEGRGEDYSVDINMESKGVVTDDGYNIEVAIPFKSLRYEAGKAKNWGLHVFRRVKYNNNELDAWMPNNRSINGSLIQAGQVTGLEGIETTRQLEINPSFTVSETGRRTRNTFNGDPNGRYVNEGIKGDFGMTAKLSLSPAVTLDFAYNPDFAQVEADAPVSTTNVRFPIFFAEKRPFFLERIDIFQSGMNVVNTRAIVDPDIAAKLTGRRGKNTFGIMYASDNAPGNYSVDERESLRQCKLAQLTDPTRVCSVERFLDQNADIGVLRIKRDIGATHNLGFFATTYNFVDRHNHTSGFDGRFKLTPKVIAEFQVLGTNSRRNFYNPDIDRNQYRTGNGFGYRGFLQRSDRNLYLELSASGRSPDYRADVGFTNRTDTNYLGTFVRYETDRTPKNKIIFKRLFNQSNINYDWSGRSQGYQSNNQGMLAFQRQVYVGAGFELGYERVFEHEFGARRTATRPTQGAFFGPSSERSTQRKEVYGFVEASPWKQWFFLVVLSQNFGSLDYDFGAGPKYPRVSAPYVAWYNTCGQFGSACTTPAPRLDPGAGDMTYLESSVRYQPTTAFQIQVNYNRSRLARNDTGLVAFDDNILSVRSTYQFTRNVFARMRLDYSNVASRIRPQFVFGWTPSPGTALYAG
ncbi:MAG: carbohydrate binding family 9 domain-containing protein, partial [Pyrinomonadaceae bacterium]